MFIAENQQRKFGRLIAHTSIAIARIGDRMKLLTLCAAVVYILPQPTHPPLPTQTIPLTKQNILEVHTAITKPLNYRGKDALEVRDAAPQAGDDSPRMVLIKGINFSQGTIDVYLSGDTAPDAPANLRGFVGIAFHIASDRTRYECIYLRPKNGHSTDTVQRTHATQYIAQPDFTWNKLRTETPGKYESSADIQPGEWIHVRIQITGKRATLFVNDAKEATLTINDRLGTVDEGPIALWVGPGTIANFADLKVTTQN